MGKRKFSHAERYAVWLHHQKRCWLCREPLRLIETTIDHVIPESLLDDESARAEAFHEYGLAESFDINGFENWLPCHNHCNQSKGNATFVFIPGNKLILDRLAKKASKVAKTARGITQNVTKDKVFASVFVALERQELLLEDLHSLIADLGGSNGDESQIEMIQLDSGYWLAKEDVVLEAECRCERDVCVGKDTKVNCVFSRMLSDWVTKTGLYWQCYDEIIQCPRCNQEHKRGHIGRADVCGKPFADQENQRD